MTAWHLAVIAILAVAIRVPVWLSRTHVTFDEGVFLASTDLAAAGFTQYRDFFTSQGPLFIPLLQVGDFLGFGDSRGPRTIMLLAGAAIAISMYFILVAVTTRSRAFLVSAFLATSGAVLMASGPVQSDGPALALAMTGLAIAIRRGDRTGAVLAGALLGAAVAIKSLHVVPTVLMVAIVLAYRRNWLNLAYTALTGIALALATILFYGVERVWDQYVLFHLARDNSPSLGENLIETGKLLFEFDLPIIILAVTTVFFLRQSKVELFRYGPELPGWLPAAWLAVTLIVVVGFTQIDPGSVRVLAFVIPPTAMLLTSHLHIPDRVLVGMAILAVVFQVWTIDVASEPGTQMSALVDRIERIDEEAFVVSDDPGLLWSARRLSHPSTVDPSHARFETGYLTTDGVDRALRDTRTCAYVATSERFDSAGITPPGIYQPTSIEGFYLRDGC